MDICKGVLVHAKPYSFQDGNVLRQGVTIQYFLTDNLEPNDSGDEKGYKMCKESIDLHQWNNVSAVPAVYDFEFKLVPGANNKPVLRVQGVKFSHLLAPKNKDKAS